MKRSYIQRLAPLLVPILSFSLFVAGCAGVNRSTQNTAPLHDENTAFSTNAELVKVLDVATVIFVNNNYSITLANERIGLLQTDYVSLGSLQTARPDSLVRTPLVNNISMRITLNVEERAGSRMVQFRGAFQRDGRGSEADNLIARYWLERITQDIAESLDVTFRPRIALSDYAEAVKNAEAEQSGTPDFMNNNIVRAIGITALVLFTVTLITGVFSPGASEGP